MYRLKIDSLIKQNEGPKLDYKLKLSLDTESEKKELAKDIAAIANTNGGRGYIIFGIEDKTKKVVGVQKDNDIEEKIQQVIANRIDPPIPIRMEYIEYKNKILGILTIFKSRHRPHQIRQNGAFYIRRGSTTDVARRYEIANMFKENAIISSEMMPIYNSFIDEIDEKLVYKYCQKINIKEEISIKLLENLGICVKTEEAKYHPTLGGLLVFGKYPQKHILGSSVRVTLDLENESIIKVFQGNIIYILDEVESYIKYIFQSYDYPLEGFLECVRNSLVHRDYFDLNRETNIYIGKNKVEVSNPGTLTYGDTLNSILREKNPSRRNAWIHQRLIIMDDKMRFLGSGMGIGKIKEAFKDIGGAKFYNIYNRNLFRVVLPGIEYNKVLLSKK
ncbi:Predicted transcriptional regulator, contains HTH domain [Alkalithermobacter thermoalcaliphilus JW-YL-7 = DSM 7308]|uniref:Predicted transcriptional regulator, contains HTH domain n=1 Tax=Alkalithermobacter thermoalcaliphilus JW-YL-7 = DSM 7308 TaxID=1121328 RepID=A0A150FRG5_CLOPD|nr:putative transcriptional regulator [[Clostridium] paradoxum JW-YL-7 = DSM 7308]SHK43463.1 Predicted transcriptional regulator, contains HTH domain [[Clostridium] paradoxum JW-YL-7 = DSM 7308]